MKLGFKVITNSHMLQMKRTKRVVATIDSVANEVESAAENCRNSLHQGIEYCLSGCMGVIFLFGMVALTFAAFKIPATIQSVTFPNP